MYFKALELIGFKSFAEKTRLNFEPGVTAVVGPNGCGKSNIADAIRWVLGEQSAKSLRASNMQDVIFNGTDNKEPISYAEVSLTFDNQQRSLPIDYDEVIITRRIFRSGDTEYLLNKTPVRLKDISELLMGTGIGTESYSIIEQGKMDMILSSRPEDRRYVFEEASGITKYKSKKKEALRKLEQTEQNLLRINDIIQEVKRQIGSIERQARKAERYKVDFDKMKEMELKISSAEYKNLKTQEATYGVESGDAKSRERDLEAEVSALSAKIANYRQLLDEINRNILEIRNHATETSGALDMNNQKIGTDRERIEEAVAFRSGLEKEMASLSDKIKSAKEQIGILRVEFEGASSRRSEKERVLKEKEAFALGALKEVDDIESRIKVSKVNMVDNLAKSTRIKNELIKLGVDVQNRRARQRRLSLEKDRVSQEFTAVEGKLESATCEYKTIEERAAKARSDLAEKRRISEESSVRAKEISDRIVREDTRVAALRSKIEVLSDIVKRHEGFTRAVQSILAKKESSGDELGGIAGVLADMIKVKPGYEEAVSVFLGTDAQIVIAEKDRDVAEAIKFLKDNRSGKATFVSLETLERIGKDSRNASGTGNDLKPLEGFVRIDERYAAVLEHLFAGAYLCERDEDLEAHRGSGSEILITKSGLIYDNGRISGGSESDADGSLLVGREERLKALEKDLAAIEEGAAALKTESLKLEDDNRVFRSGIADLEASVHVEEMALSNAAMKKSSEESSAMKIKEELELLASELAESDESILDLTKSGESLNIELNKAEAEKTSAEVFVEESLRIVVNKKADREKALIEMATFAAELQSYDKEEESVRNNLKTQEALTFGFEETLYARDAAVRDSTEKAGILADEISRLSAQNTELAAGLEKLGREASELETRKSDMNDKFSIEELQLDEKKKALEDLKNQSRDLDVKLAELGYKKTNLKERIAQAYKIDLESEHIELEDNPDWEAFKSQVTDLKDRLEKMGPVNLVAIEEHKELEERYSFLVHQQEDLVNAKDSLHKAIQKINKTTKDLFLEAFGKIQVEFKSFFRLLFGGGQAELVLIDEQDILESGIEIVVRPPGKKLQNLMLLSGGEKALTAISLLFAIFKVKPSPFCVLDEIDAPLDESNVLRFSNVLKDFLKISQFIIITHNKRTIELADVMYGITMQERGVSKIVSVKFAGAETKEPEPPKEARAEVLTA